MIMATIIKRADSLTELPLISRLCRQLSPQGEAAKRLTIFAKKMKFAEFFSGKGKPELKAKKFFAENFANPPEKRLQFFFGYGIVYKLLMQTEV